MIIGIGIDITERSRIQKVLNHHPEKFPQRILAAGEIVRMSKLRNEGIVSFLAKRFSVKEAVSKSIGCGIGSFLAWKDIETKKMPGGRPYVEINQKIIRAILTLNPKYVGAFLDKWQKSNPNKKPKLKDFQEHFKIHISISDERQNAVTQAILEIL